MPFRVGLLFMLFYLTCFSIGAFVFYKNTQVKVNQLMDSVLTQRHNKMERAFARDGIEGVITGIRATESDDPLDFGVAYQLSLIHI